MPYPDVQQEGALVRVWDPFVRLFHWSLVTGMAAAWLTSSIRSATHQWIGLAVAALVGLRILWGFVAPGRARFSDFVKGPVATLGYLGDVLRGRERRYLGHNPAGGAMIVALILFILATCLTGYEMTTDAWYGDDTMQFFHSAFADAVVALIILHLAGVAIASFRHRENLPRAMVTGLKRPAEEGDVA